ncbi:MAG TPA: hypothetical protein VEH06_18550 [Candidatus Bathyarchaeia archaeon]|nr:hypothetical protein [Candidatus Bathyarchaeia archaeon]
MRIKQRTNTSHVDESRSGQRGRTSKRCCCDRYGDVAIGCARRYITAHGRTISVVLAAAVYIACREMGAHRTLDDIAAGSNVKREEVSKNFRVLHTCLDLKIPQQDPMKCIAKVANVVKLSEKTKRKAADIMSNVMKEELSAGKDPMALAASILYLSSIKTGEC